MSARLQAGLALALALGLHLAVFAFRPEAAGAVSSGAGGADLVSLQAADASLSDLVAEWDRPPAPQSEALAELAPPPMQAEAPAAPAMAEAPPQLPPPAALTPPAMAEALPSFDQPPPPPPEPAPVAEAPAAPEPPKVRPKPKPTPRTAETEPQQAAKPAAKPAPAKPSTAQAPQRASGSGGGPQAGTRGTAQAATLSKAQLNDLKASWGASIRSRIERRKTYPSAARGAAGTVTVRLTVSRSGQLGAVTVTKSSGNAALDQAATRAVTSARKFPAAPKGLTDASYSFTLPITFSR